MYGITTRTRAYGSAVSVAAIIVILATVASPARAQVGRHWPAGVTCSGIGKIQTQPMYEKVGPLQTGSIPQQVAHMYLFWNIDTRTWYETTWSGPYFLARNASFYSVALLNNWSVPRGRYYVYARYAWNLLDGAGWNYATDRTQEYGSFDYMFTDTYCHAQPLTTVVEGGSNFCSDYYGLCAAASSTQRVTRIRGMRRRSPAGLPPSRAPSATPILPPVAVGSRR